MFNITEVINKENLGLVANRLGSAILNPNTLTGIGVVLVPVTIGLAIKGTIKAMKEAENVESDDFFDKARVVWKYYVPVMVTGTMCVVCIIASNRLSEKERAALTSALAVSEEALRQYQAKLEADKGVKTKVEMKEKADKETKVNTISDVDEDDINRLDSLPREDEVWCRDKVTGAMFKTTKAKLDMVNGMLLKQMTDEKQGWVMSSINDMYGMLGAPYVEIGNDYLINCHSQSEGPLEVGSDVATNGEFMLTLDYYTDNANDI